MKRLAIYTCATESYTYALEAQARKIQAAIQAVNEPLEIAVFVVSEGNKAAHAAVDLYEKLLPGSHIVHLIEDVWKDGAENYKVPAQLLIAQMRTTATCAARAWGADLLLAMDSDVLPPANAIRCMLDVLAWDGGYYGVAACPYPSQGGGDFLCGRGTPQNPILPDFYDEEKDIPQEMLDARQKARDEFDPKDPAKREALKTADDAIRALPPKGSVFAMNAVEWKRRGWFSQAYPGIGKGAIVPTDWCGFGCTMMNREAMALCDFSGYGGEGTEDLFICWHRWEPAGIRIAAIPHCPCDHVIRKDGKHEHCFAGHEGGGECVGHLRQQRRAWYGHSPGESPAV